VEETHRHVKIEMLKLEMHRSFFEASEKAGIQLLCWFGEHYKAVWSIMFDIFLLYTGFTVSKPCRELLIRR